MVDSIAYFNVLTIISGVKVSIGPGRPGPPTSGFYENGPSHLRKLKCPGGLRPSHLEISSVMHFVRRVK